MQKIGVLTSGGDCPGLNAVIRAVVKTAVNELDMTVVGIRDGFQGLLDPVAVVDLDLDAVRGLLPRGGTVLGASNRGNPLRWPGPSVGEVRDRSDELIASARRLGLDAVVVIGGDGSLAIAHQLALRGLPVIGVPKTIDNDISLTDLCFGFDSALATATDAIDKLHTTAESHHRVMVVEVMGRNVGWIALAAGIAGGADVILLPEIPFSPAAIVRKIEDRAARGRTFSIVVVAEGALPAGRSETYLVPGTTRLGGIGDKVGADIAARSGREVRTTVLGHIQRGGSPSPYDRVLASRFGAAAARLAKRGGLGRMVALEGRVIGDVAIADAIAELKRVPVDGELVQTARSLGISLGDRPGAQEE